MRDTSVMPDPALLTMGVVLRPVRQVCERDVLVQAVDVLQAAHRRDDGSVPERFDRGRLFDQLYDSLHCRTAERPRFWVAQADGTVVGVAGYRRAWCSGFGWELAYAGVRPEWQGLGLGRALIRARLVAIASEGQAGDFVLVRSVRPATFQRLGFSPCPGDPKLMVGRVGALAALPRVPVEA